MPRAEFGSRVLVDGVCDFIRFTFASKEEADGVEGNPRVGIDPEIAEWGESQFWGRMRFSDRLTMMHVFVRAELGLYEYDCTGQSKVHSVSDEFRAEADERHGNDFWPSIERRPVAPAQWTPTIGRLSSESRLRGEDFPAHGMEREGRAEHADE